MILRRLFELYKEYVDWKDEREANKQVCQSCETTKQQLAIANIEKDKLLARLLEKPEPIPEKEPVEVTRPAIIPWRVRRQMLQDEDRQKAILMRKAKDEANQAPTTEVKVETKTETKTTDELEKEVVNASL